MSSPMQCPVCKGPLARRAVRTVGTFSCTRCGASLAADPAQQWRRRTLYGVLAGVVTGLLAPEGGGLFALLVASAVMASDLPVGNVHLRESDGVASRPIATLILTTMTVVASAMIPYSVLTSLMR